MEHGKAVIVSRVWVEAIEEQITWESSALT